LADRKKELQKEAKAAMLREAEKFKAMKVPIPTPIACLLSAVCSLLSAVCCLLSAACCLLSAVCCLLSAAGGGEVQGHEGAYYAEAWLFASDLSDAYCLLAVCCPLCDDCCLLSAVCCTLFDDCSLIPSVLAPPPAQAAGTLPPVEKKEKKDKGEKKEKKEPVADWRAPPLRTRLQTIVDSQFARITYTEAIDLLQKAVEEVCVCVCLSADRNLLPTVCTALVPALLCSAALFNLLVSPTLRLSRYCRRQCSLNYPNDYN
jgi:hypothetical protein